MQAEQLQRSAERERTYADWASPKGFRTSILPWKLYDRAKALFWDPAKLDFSKDAEQWAAMTDEHKVLIASLARGFMIGEESVTLDILPLMMAIADEGRVEETMYLTTFAFEEARHVELFRLWFDALGWDLEAMDDAIRENQAALGFAPKDPGSNVIFERELPNAMRRLLVDHSPQAFLDAAVTYNQFVEGCLAIAGYKAWTKMFEHFGVLPGLREGLVWIQRDERRHIAYGTYLARRIIARHPDLLGFAEQRMRHLEQVFFGQGVLPVGDNPTPAEGAFGLFAAIARAQVNRRIAVLAKAAELTPEQAEFGIGADEAEAESEDEAA